MQEANKEATAAIPSTPLETPPTNNITIEKPPSPTESS